MPKATVGGGQKYPPCPAGVVQAICVDVIDLGMVKSVYQGEEKTQHKVNIVWQVDERREDGKRYHISKRYTLSLHEKAALRKDIEALRGRPFTKDDEEAGFEVEDLKGTQALLGLVHKDSKGKTYTNINSLMPLPKGMPKLEQEEYKRWVPKDQQAQNAAPADEPDLIDDDIPF